MRYALFEAVLLRTRRQQRAIDNEEQQKWPKMRRQHTNSSAGARHGKLGFKPSCRSLVKENKWEKEKALANSDQGQNRQTKAVKSGVNLMRAYFQDLKLDVDRNGDSQMSGQVYPDIIKTGVFEIRFFNPDKNSGHKRVDSAHYRQYRFAGQK